MKIFSFVLAALAVIAFGLSLWIGTRLVAVVGAGVLIAAIIYATWITQTSNDGSYRKAERAAKRQREESSTNQES